MPTSAPGSSRRSAGFTLVEVLVALGIVAIALVAGLQATAALTNNARRQSDVLLAQMCAENELIRMRLARRVGLLDVVESLPLGVELLDFAVADHHLADGITLVVGGLGAEPEP